MSKRLGLFIACLLLIFLTQAEAAITRVANQTTNNPTGTTCNQGCHSNVNSGTIAFPNNVTQNNLLLVGGCSYDETLETSVTVTDTRTTSYNTTNLTFDIPFGGDGVFCFVAYGIAPSSGANTVTVNPSGATSYFTISIDEFSGVDTSTPLDADGGSTAGGPSTTPSDSVTTTTANALVVGLLGLSTAGSPALAAGTGYTLIGEYEDNTAVVAHSFIFQIVTTAQAYTVDWTTDSITWEVGTGSFRAAAVSAVSRMMLLGVGP